MISGPPNTTLFRTSAKPALGNVNFLQTSGADIITHDDVKYFRLQTVCLQTCWHYDEDLKKRETLARRSRTPRRLLRHYWPELVSNELHFTPRRFAFTKNCAAKETLHSEGLRWTNNWSGRRDLNPGPLAPQASALARLRHGPMLT